MSLGGSSCVSAWTCSRRVNGYGRRCRRTHVKVVNSTFRSTQRLSVSRLLHERLSGRLQELTSSGPYLDIHLGAPSVTRCMLHRGWDARRWLQRANRTFVRHLNFETCASAHAHPGDAQPSMTLQTLLTRVHGRFASAHADAGCAAGEGGEPLQCAQTFGAHLFPSQIFLLR